MKARLKIHIAGDDFVKEIDIDFVPTLGMLIELEPEIQDDDRRAMYRESLNKHGSAVIPIFKVDEVKYRAGDRSLSVNVSFTTPHEKNSFTTIEQLVYGFGFTTWVERM